MTRVWITRAEPGATATAARLRLRGFDPVIAPLIETRRLAVEADLAGVAALAFTSAAGAAAFASICEARDRPVYAVGEATAAAALDASWTEVTSADGDVAALARRILADKARIAGAVLHTGAAASAGDLVGALTRAGMSARFLAVYETVPAARPDAVLEDIGSLAAVLVHSPSAGAQLGEILAGTPAPHLAAYCLSPAVAASLGAARIGRIFTAALPNEDALLSLLADQAPNGES
ncbi:MAG TPA: uroporphyrinogen-III synthase [Caulobacteraceae bacterium]